MALIISILRTSLHVHRFSSKSFFRIGGSLSRGFSSGSIFIKNSSCSFAQSGCRKASAALINACSRPAAASPKPPLIYTPLFATVSLEPSITASATDLIRRLSSSPSLSACNVISLTACLNILTLFNRLLHNPAQPVFRIIRHIDHLFGLFDWVFLIKIAYLAHCPSLLRVSWRTSIARRSTVVMRHYRLDLWV